MDYNFTKILQERFGLVGDSQPMQEAIQMLMQAAPTDLTVLITGETGTGKEVFSQAVHSLSNRKKFPFVSVNCGAIPESLLESELFGHEKGAFTGAHEQRKGFFEVANRGTIFLDEIGEMPFSTQVKLLRVLESGEFSRIGSTAVQKVDVRVIAATNRTLEEEVQNGNFRQDLYYRLKNVHIYLPALRNHPEDIPALYDYFARNICEKIGIEYKGVANDVVEIFKRLEWSGNIRELKNLVETMITLEKVSYITPEVARKYLKPTLPPHIATNVPDSQALVRIGSNNNGSSKENAQFELGLIFRSLLALQNEVNDLKSMSRHTIAAVDEIKDTLYHGINLKQDEIPVQSYNEMEALEDLNLADIEKKFISESLRRFNSNRRLAAKALGVSERTLYRKIAEYGLE